MNQGIYEDFVDFSRLLRFVHVYNSECILHFHENIEIVYVVRGEIEYTNNVDTQTLRPGEVILIPPYFSHRFHSLGNTYSVAVVIPGQYHRDYHSEFGDLSLPKMTDPYKNAKILALMRNIERNTSETSELIRIGEVNLLLGTIIESYPSYPYQKSDTMMKDIAVYIDHHFQEKITLEDIASHFGYNRCYFSRLFRSLFHVSFLDYVNNMRCEYVRRHLEEGSMTEIIYHAGFTSTSSYYRHLNKRGRELVKE